MKKIFMNFLNSLGWSLAAGIVAMTTLTIMRMIALVVISLFQGNYYEGVIDYTPNYLNKDIFYGSIMLTITIMILVFDHSWERMVKKNN
jgi:hypothetical protein